MQKTLLIYESKYGTTQKIAKHLSMVLGPAKYIKTNEFNDLYKDFDFIVIGSPVYSGKLDPMIYEFVKNNEDWLKEKPVALFSTSLSPKDGNKNLDELGKITGNIISKKALGGVLKFNTLNDEDKEALNAFSEKVGFELKDMDNFNLENVLDYALELKSLKDDLISKTPPVTVKESIDEFLKSHNTCTLSTSYNERVRSTPIEYNYFDGFIYVLSEGGEKFSNILINKNVSLAVYNDYTGMDKLAGMQISGEAYIVEDMDEYEKIIQMKGLNVDFIKNMPFNMNIIKIEIKKIEFLYSEFKKMGYEPRQIYNFKSAEM
ncbi:MAG TPA: flavodoxin domain-containing protein [Methanobacterium sp.]|nr:flavodoxin domain-containing protein [Methanobacterium sp.]